MGGTRKKEPSNKRKTGLDEDLEDPWKNGIRPKPRGKRRKQLDDDDEEVGAEELGGPMGEKIMREARAQQAELDQENGGPLADHVLQPVQDSDDEEEYGRRYGGARSQWIESESYWDGGADMDLSPEEEAALEAFMGDGSSQQPRTIADIILSKIREKEQAGPLEDHQAAPQMPPEIEESFRICGKLLARYTSGAVPKVLKIIPSLVNWEEALYLTEPEGWSPHAVFRATRLFISNLKPAGAQRFLTLVLLPHVRQDIRQNKRLHFALYEAMKKAAFKADAFYKGLVLPLVLSGSCTLREAVIMSSVLQRVSLPPLHSAAALARLADAPYSGITSFFIRVLLDKRYALPYRVIDMVVDHFLRFKSEARTLPVVWHQSLLTFVQRYKQEIRGEDKLKLRELLKVQFHYLITPEVFRELDASR
eukprot:jgi/Botrbrau1/21623/Bobra.43_1s0025.2